MCRGLRDCVEKEREGGGGTPALKAAAADPAGTFTAATAEAGDGEEPEGAAGDACANVGGTGGAEEEAETAAGGARTAMTGDTTGEGCEGEEEDPHKYLMIPFVGFTRSGSMESAPWR